MPHKSKKKCCLKLDNSKSLQKYQPEAYALNKINHRPMKKLITLPLTAIFLFTACASSSPLFTKDSVYSPIETEGSNTLQTPNYKYGTTEDSKLLSFANATFLSSVIDASESCQSYYNINSTHEIGSLTSEETKKEFRKYMSNDGSEIFTEKLVAVSAEEGFSMVSLYCPLEENFYVTFINSDDHSFDIAKFDGQSVTIQKGMHHGIDTMHFFFPEYFDEDTHLAGAPYGEFLPNWEIYKIGPSLDEPQMLEHCEIGYDTDSGSAFPHGEEKILICGLQFDPDHGVIQFQEEKLNECENEQDASKKDKCLLQLSEFETKSRFDRQLDANTVCPEIENSESRDSCFWNYAMALKDPSLCENIVSHEFCKATLNYSTNKGSWALESGIPGYSGSTNYDGSAEVRGWAYLDVSDTNYQSLKFKIVEQDLVHLPPYAQSYSDFDFTIWTAPRESMRNLTELEALPEWMSTDPSNLQPVTVHNVILHGDDYQSLWFRNY